MKLHTRTRYGTRSMLDLALNNENGTISNGEIVARQQISRKYLEHLLAALSSAGLVRSVRGAQGGHTLTRPPEQIVLREISDVFEWSGDFVDCTTRLELCNRINACVAHEIWARLYVAFQECCLEAAWRLAIPSGTSLRLGLAWFT